MKEPAYKKMFGEFIKDRRLGMGISMRQFCLDNNFNPGNYSRMERGAMAPPASEKILERYAKALKIKKGTDEWIDFFDMAFACRGEIPVKILNDDKLVQKLPVFFKTLRGEKLSEEKLKEIAEIIREKENEK